MKLIASHPRKIAFCLLCIMVIQLVSPTVSYALTSGPSQPEMKGFEPIGNTDMVDLFSGDFSYNIPLMDVGGYPINLAYHSGASLDDEASWVGYGWSLNVGSVNRQLRGLPDDFNGTDHQEREMSMKDHVTTGGKFSVSLDALGIPVPKFNKKVKGKKLNLTKPTFSIGLMYDNYRGIGMDIGANSGLSLTDFSAGDKTQKSDKENGTFGLNLSSFEGAGLNINRSIFSKYIDKADKTEISKSVGFGYNTRAGLTGMTLTNSMKETKKELPNRNRNFTISSSFISFNSDVYTPTIDHPTKTNSFTFSLKAGAKVFIPFLGVGLTGFHTQQSTAETLRKLPSFGFMYSDKAKNEPAALMDMNREKDIPYSNKVKYLPIPIPGYDLFSATSQDGGGQYRAYSGSSGVFADPRTETNSRDYSLGTEIGGGAYFILGADLNFQAIKTKPQKWIDRNKILDKIDFQSSGSSPLYEPVYFKRVGEPVPADENYLDKIKNVSPLAVKLTSNIANAVEGTEASDKIRTPDSKEESIAMLRRDKREIRNTTFSYLTAKEASHGALEKTIKDYKPDSLALNDCMGQGIKNTFSRNAGYRNGHHISEVTITGDDGKRSIYGIPVYNVYQEEVSFSIGADLSKRKKGLIGYTKGIDDTIYNKKGRDNYYSKEVTKPYATSYLLTALLSPDYIDKTGNGISDDDLGTAVKFNYTKLDALYKWRTPFANAPNTANYNEGFQSDQLDDKASYVYGEKEIWYLHSIESKTMVAQFILGDREDGLGVTGDGGSIDTQNRLKYLKEIRLFSKSDLQQHNNNPSQTTPIKVVHFSYNYSVCRGLPNSTGNNGKLTLEKVYFTFGENNKGKLNPYAFSYDTTYNNYDYRQYDRWGTFKDADSNSNGLNNSEFPYTLQDTALSNKFASVGQLKKIILPSGGMISVTYEADDYAYVLDKRASQMCMVKGTNSDGKPTGLISSDYIYVDLPVPVYPSALKSSYFDGVDKLYFKFLLDLDGLGHKEFVPGYAQILDFSPAELDAEGKTKTVKIKLEKVDSKNPIAKAGWQFLRMNLPKYAYPNSENLESNDGDIVKTFKALVAAFGSIKELIEGFEGRAERKGYCDAFEKGKSWVRLCSPVGKKIGGGLRVKRIDMTDDWTAMSGTSEAKTATYSQIFDYTTTDGKGKVMSSGVASYEPMVGNDENPFRQPVNYKQNKFLGLDNYYYIEEPFCESLFPAASVGYSKVTVKSIGTGDDVNVNRTGTTVSEFYTAKEYPTEVKPMGLDQKKPISSLIFKLIGGISHDVLGLSQGYSIELNDMHGKPKSTNVFNRSGQNISSVKYFYKTENELAESKELRNEVKVINAEGKISDGLIGLDVETYTDMRQQTTDNLGASAAISGGAGAILFFPLPFFFPGVGINYDRRSYRASSTLKIINRFAIQYKVEKTQDGSNIKTENLLWDAETGNVVLTKSQNEFDDPVYSFAYPAHWVYKGMGQAYQNLGTVLSNFSTRTDGTIINPIYENLLAPGDELIDINSGVKYWVVNSPTNNDFYQKRIIDENGDLQIVSGVSTKLIRSGRRNMANTAIATITSLNNPIVNNQLGISDLTKVLDAKANVFSEEWSVPGKIDCVNRFNCTNGYSLSEDSTHCFFANYLTAPDSIRSSFVGTLCPATHLSYTITGTLIYDSTVQSNGTGGHPTLIDTSNSHWRKQSNESISGPLNRCGIWHCDDKTDTNWKAITVYLNTPSTKTYYVGLSADNFVRLTVNGSQRFVTTGNTTFYNWHVIPIKLGAGVNSITLEGRNEFGSVGSFGAEVYDNSAQQIASATSDSSLKIVFSTRELRDRTLQNNVTYVSACPDGYTLDTAGGFKRCTQYIANYPGLGLNNVINPYSNGMLGNWRPKSAFVYQVNRESLASSNTIGSTNIRKAGAYSLFNPFWQYSSSANAWQQNPVNDSRWIAANEITYYNTKGTEIENKDALGHYSSALFGYLESLPIAVASNSRYREIAYDGFEDYHFSLGCLTADSCNTGHFNFKSRLGPGVSLSNQYAHSGKYSLSLSGTVALNKTVLLENSTSLYSYNSFGQYLLGSNELAKGFSPLPGKKYLLSFWIKDNNPRDPSANVQAIVNGKSLVSNLSKWPVVEGWKRIEVPFVLSPLSHSFSLQFAGSGAYIDDIRIHPYEGQMKSFAYDASSQQLMAELDENNFATFYEYDDEGILVRVKKETERGIMTIKETRSSYRRN